MDVEQGGMGRIVHLLCSAGPAMADVGLQVGYLVTEPGFLRQSLLTLGLQGALVSRERLRQSLCRTELLGTSPCALLSAVCLRSAAPFK